MSGAKKSVRVIRKGEVRDSRAEGRRHWAARSPAERVAALKELRASTFFRLHGRPMGPMSKAARPIKDS